MNSRLDKEQNIKVLEKESNSHCVAKLEAKWNTKSVSYSTTRWSTYLSLDGMPSRKTSHIPSSSQSDHPSGSPSVAMSVYTSTFSIITPTTFPSYVLNEKQMMLVLYLLDFWMDIQEFIFQKITHLYTLLSHQKQS